jgi:hypothetical protein
MRPRVTQCLAASSRSKKPRTDVPVVTALMLCIAAPTSVYPSVSAYRGTTSEAPEKLWFLKGTGFRVCVKTQPVQFLLGSARAQTPPRINFEPKVLTQTP